MGGSIKELAAISNGLPLFYYTSYIILYSNQIIFFNINETITCQCLKNVQQFLNKLRKKKSQSFTSIACKLLHGLDLVISLQSFPISGPLSKLTLLSRMYFPTLHLAVFLLIPGSQTIHHSLSLTLKLDTSSCSLHQYSPHPTACTAGVSI